MIDISTLIKNAMKSKNQVELRAYKNLKAEIQILRTAKNAKPYDGVAEIQLISKMCKKLEDDILGFSKAGREDLVSEYGDELEVLKKLLPEPVNESQIDSKLMKWCAENGFRKENGKIVAPYKQQLYTTIIPKKEMGNAIKFLKSEFPQADGKMISNIVKEYLV